MQPTDKATLTWLGAVFWDDAPEPEVVWSDDGIDALLWADPPPPYAKQPPTGAVEITYPSPAGVVT